MTINRMMMPTIMQIRIFMSFHHICLRTRLAPRRKPCADVARLSVLSCRASRRSPRCEALFRLSCIWRTVLSISCLFVALSASLLPSPPRGLAVRPPVACRLSGLASLAVADRRSWQPMRLRDCWVNLPSEAHRCANRLPGRQHRGRGCRGGRKAARGRPL